MPTKSGYVFRGWYEKSDFTGSKIEKIKKGSSGNKKFYAKWTAGSYKVIFDANGGMGSMPAQDFVYGTAQTLTANAFSKTGFVFAGWNTQSDASGVNYTDKASVFNLTAESGGTVTLYAVWMLDLPPADVTDLNAESGRHYITLRWKNPADTDFEKVVITNGSQSIEVNKADGETKQIAGLSNGKHTFIVKAYDAAGNASSGVSV